MKMMTTKMTESSQSLSAGEINILVGFMGLCCVRVVALDYLVLLSHTKACKAAVFDT